MKKTKYGLIVELENSIIDTVRFSDIFDSNISNPLVFYFVYEREKSILGFISINLQKLLHHTANIAKVQELIVQI